MKVPRPPNPTIVPKLAAVKVEITATFNPEIKTGRIIGNCILYRICKSVRPIPLATLTYFSLIVLNALVILLIIRRKD